MYQTFKSSAERSGMPSWAVSSATFVKRSRIGTAGSTGAAIGAVAPRWSQSTFTSRREGREVLLRRAGADAVPVEDANAAAGDVQDVAGGEVAVDRRGAERLGGEAVGQGGGGRAQRRGRLVVGEREERE